jgi:hypothetical protein
METAAQPRPQPPKGLNKLLNNDEPPVNGTSQLRDSGFYSTDGISSKRMSSMLSRALPWQIHANKLCQ